MNWVLFLTALMLTESDGNWDAIGDRNLKHQAYTAYQIRQPYLDDVNRIMKTSYTMSEVRDSQTVAKWCVVAYIKHYGKRYTRLTGKPLTMEVAARLHNGGPNGWKRSATDKHWTRFQDKLKKVQ